MKRLKYCLLPLLYLILFVILAGVAGPAPHAPQKQQNFLWKVITPNSTAYILGSIHLMKPEMYPLNPAIETAFKSADSLVVEVNLNNVDMAKAANMIASSAIYTDSRTLKSAVSESTYRQTESKLREIGMDINIFQKTKPWMVAMTLTDISLRKLGFDPMHGIDIYFLKKSGTKKIIELESFDFQISLFNTFSDREDELFLMYTIKDLDNVSNDMNSLITAWKAGDAATLERLIASGIQDAPELQQVYRRLFTERNFSMTSKIESILKNRGTYFIVVGAGHLVGKSGIINLLQKKGFKVQQM
ncbi:MAG: TraB/GumN family protein [Nitrospiraceae bacterium]|nr:TraB/GumN family protein [Nitrospiraceae bacterium]